MGRGFFRPASLSAIRGSRRLDPELAYGTLPGFGVRITNKARKSFFLFYRSRRSVGPSPPCMSTRPSCRASTMPASARAILGPDAERKSATQALPPLTWAVRDHHHDRPVLARQIELAAKIPHGIEELSRRIDALFRGLEQARAATRSPEKALEIAARQLGYRTVRAALELLPGSASAPVLSAVRAVEMALSVGRGFSR